MPAAEASQGQAVFFRAAERIGGGIVLEIGKTAVSVLLPGLRRTRVEPGELLCLSTRRFPTPEAGLPYVERVLACEAQLDMRTVWELALEAGAAPMTLSEIVSMCGTGDEVPDAVAAALARPDSFFKRKGEAFVPHPARVIADREIQARRTRERQEALARVVSELRSLQAAAAGMAGASEDARQTVALLQQCALEPGEPHPQAGRLLDALYPGSTVPHPLLAFELMVALGLWDRHEDLNLRKLAIPTEFSQAALGEVAAVRAAVDAELLRRPDLGRLLALALDDAETQEVDDALAVEEQEGRTVVHVLISDVASAVPSGSALDAEAFARATTVYHPTGRIPMFPPELSADLLSLQEGGIKLAVDHRLTFGPDLALLAFDVVPCAVSIHRRLTYEQADELLAAGQGAEAAALQILQRLAERLFAARTARGALSFYPHEVKVRVRDHEVHLARIDTFSPSRRLVAEFMVAAGSNAADLLSRRSVPAIFRGQAAPEEPIAWTLDKARNPAFIASSVRRLRRAGVSLRAEPHAALGIPAYCQVTSPLRRYADLLVQRQLLAAVRGGQPPYGEPDLLARIAACEQTNAQVRRVVDDSERYWKQVALAAHVDKEVEATVLFEERKQIQVLLPDFGLQARYYCKRVPAEGDTVRLVVVKVEPRLDVLVLREL